MEIVGEVVGPRCELEALLPMLVLSVGTDLPQRKSIFSRCAQEGACCVRCGKGFPLVFDHMWEVISV